MSKREGTSVSADVETIRARHRWASAQINRLAGWPAGAQEAHGDRDVLLVEVARLRAENADLGASSAGWAKHVPTLLAEIERLAAEVAALRVLAPIVAGDRVRVTGRYPFVSQDIESCEGVADHVDSDGGVLVAFDPPPETLGGRISRMRVGGKQLERVQP